MKMKIDINKGKCQKHTSLLSSIYDNKTPRMFMHACTHINTRSVVGFPLLVNINIHPTRHLKVAYT